MERYLRECLDSVLAQSLRSLEAICVDDGSTDSSPKILAEYAERDSRVKVIRQENAGSGPARNTGIAASTGNYLMFLDPDDFYPDREVVEKLHAAVLQSGLQVARGRVNQVAPDGRTQFPKYFAIPLPWPPAGRRSYREFQSPAGFCQCLYSRGLIVGNGITFPAFRRCQDPAFFIRAMGECQEFFQIDDFTLARRNGYKTINKKANSGFVEKEVANGQRLAIEIAAKYGFEKIVDAFGRLTGLRKEGFFSRIIRRLCAVGKWVQPLPSAEFVDAFFDRFDHGEFHDANLFKLIMRVMTAPRKLRCDAERTLLRRLVKAEREGALKLGGLRRRHRFLLRWLLLRARLCPGALRRGEEYRP